LIPESRQLEIYTNALSRKKSKIYQWHSNQQGVLGSLHPHGSSGCWATETRAFQPLPLALLPPVGTYLPKASCAHKLPRVIWECIWEGGERGKGTGVG
jgi:hypothetical protein